MTIRPWRGFIALALAASIAGCAYPTRNAVVDAIRPDDSEIGYRWDNVRTEALDRWSDTLVIVTASGGGTRAAALELAVLRGLDQVTTPVGAPLTDEIDVISSVSGGSVTAAYFALKGRDGFDDLYDNFIKRDGMAPLYWGLNPVSLARLSTPGRERIDLLIDYLNRQLFHDLTYAALQDGKPHPLLILNAADMVEGVPFPFTQRKFDLLCSDLSQFPLATAVASSAAFPIALSPVTLTNHTPCPATEAAQPWPPSWVTLPLGRPTGYYENDQMRLTLARVENAYARGAQTGAPDGVPQKKFIHLLDGGIADNLGVFEPYRMLTTLDTDPQLLSAIDAGAVKQLIFVVINARSFAPNALDEQAATPGMIDMALASINAPIDRATGGTAVQLRTLLNERFRQMPGNPIADNTALVSIDFDAIHDEACRRRFQSIATNWHLEEDELHAIDLVGKALLRQDPNWSKLLRIAGMTTPPSLPGIDEACAAIATAQSDAKG